MSIPVAQIVLIRLPGTRAALSAWIDPEFGVKYTNRGARPGSAVVPSYATQFGFEVSIITPCDRLWIKDARRDKNAAR